MMNRPTALVAASLLLALGFPAFAAPSPVTEASPPLAVTAPATGLVIDLGTKNMEAAMSIRVLAPNGDVIYGEFPELSAESTAQLIDMGTASFASNWSEATARAGGTPLVVRATSVGGADIQIDQASADLIRHANASGKFLEQLKVAVISSGTAAAAPPGLAPAGGVKVRAVPAWKSFRPANPAAQKALLARFKARHPRVAALLEAMMKLTPMERAVVRKYFPMGPADRPMTMEARHTRWQKLRKDHPAIGRKLRAFFQEAMDNKRPMRRHR